MPVALYREYRPRTFAELVGQEHVSRTLLNAIQQHRLAHAYLFTGPRGTGKTSMARILAKALNCPNAVDGEPCGECPTCETIASGDGVDVLELDAASNRGIEEIRTLRERIRLAPAGGRYKVYVIDEVHMLTNEAFNALLKTLEEPPTNVVFILCTTEAYRVPATILSRCQRFDFHRHPTEVIAARLAAIVEHLGQTVDSAALRAIARAATGSLRDGLSILDQCLAYTQDGVTLADARAILGAVDADRLARLTGALLDGDVGGTWRELGALLEQGRDPREMARILGHHLRDLLLFRLAGPAGEATGPLADDLDLLAQQAESASEQFLYDAIETLASGEAEIRLASQPRLVLEARLVRLCASRTPNAVRHSLATPENAANSVAKASPPAEAAPATVAPKERRTQAEASSSRVPDGAPPAVLEDSVPPPTEPPPDPEHEDARPTVPPAEQPVRRSPPRSPRPVRQEPAADAEGEAVSAKLLSRAWQAALAQLPDVEAGYLAGATPECEGGTVVVWLPEGMDWLADYLAGKATCGKLAGLLAGVTGTQLPVSVKVRAARGLFDPPGNGGAGASANDQARPAQTATAEDDIREAQLMFGAQDVTKGVH